MSLQKPSQQKPHTRSLSVTVIATLLTILFFLLVGYVVQKNLYQSRSYITHPKMGLPIVPPDPIPPQESNTTELPRTAQLSVPFTPQAPTANWDELHNESCEEASSIMAHAFFTNISSLPAEYVESELTALTAWEDTQFGYHLDIDTNETATLLKEFYKLNAEIKPLSKNAIKQALSENKLVLLAAHGQLLKNPYFKQPGPPYHMLVITGYTEDTFITNDPGTKRGYNYPYTYDILYKSSGTWSHDLHAVDLNIKNIIIVSK